MITMNLDPKDEDILAAVEAWADVLATADYSKAISLIAALPHWSADLLERVITNYGDPTKPPGQHRVTAPRQATGKAPTHEVDRFHDGVVEAWYDLPLDGEWSDLTATLVVKRREADSILELQDIHIM